MKRIHYLIALSSVFLMHFLIGCDINEDDLDPASYPTTPEVFLDDFSSGLQYAAFGGSVPTAFDIDRDVTYEGSDASMKIAVPDVNDPAGSYAGGTFFVNTGRNLTGYNALTFYAKASKSANIDVIGFGNDLGENKYQVAVNGLSVNTNWKKYYIPIPNPSKLTIEKGMFFYSEGPEDGKGYTFWIDEVKFEYLETFSDPRPQINNGENGSETAFVGFDFVVDGLQYVINLPNGADQSASVSKNYFDFSSSNESVADVDAAGNVTVTGGGTAVITASIGNVQASGSLTINSLGAFVHAPSPVYDAADVISIFSNHYSNVPVDFFNGYWEPYQTTQSADFEIDGDQVLSYVNFNFVGTQFANPTIDASGKSHIHFDIFIPGTIEPSANLNITLRDFGGNRVDGGGDDSNQTASFSGANLVAGEWNSIDIPLGLANKNNMGLIIYEGTQIPSFYVDNIFFYSVPSEPPVAAPTPTHNASNVISLFSDAYTDVPVDTWRTGWSAANFEDVVVAGNAAKKYSELNFVGIETIANQIDATGMTHFHMDVWSPDFTFFGIKLVDFGADGGFGGGDDVEHQINFELPAQGKWISLDIPLSEFVGLTTRMNMSQYILVGQPVGANTVFIDNMYFHN